MTKTVDFEGFQIELEGYKDLPGDVGQYTGPWEYCRPAEGPVYEYTKAFMIYKGRHKKLNLNRTLAALERRFGENWETM